MDLLTPILAASLLLTPPDSVRTPAGPFLPAPRLPAMPALPALPALQSLPAAATITLAAPQDTMFEYSSAYYKRLAIHRAGSYVMLPLFLAQAYVGSQLYSDTPPDWAGDVHPMLAAGVGVLFTSNTITGVWNLHEGWKDPKDRRRKLTHAILMLTADAGFVTTGILGAHAAETGEGRSTHRAVAISSMAVATTGWLLMTDWLRKDE